LFGAAHAGITVNFEGTTDGGVTWFGLAAYPVNTTGAVASSAALSTNGSSQYFLIVGAAAQIRVRSSAFTSGTLNVNIMTTQDSDPAFVGSSTAGITAPAALADGFANPTSGNVGADNMLYNGTTWDRQRSNTTSQVVDASTAKTTTGNGGTNTNYNHRGAIFQINVTAASGTTPTMVVRVQYTVDGTNFFDLDATNAVTASITTTGLHVIKVYPGLTAAVPAAGSSSANQVLPRSYRLAWTIGGTTPSFTSAHTAAYIL
jgi:hypothetical protein